MADLEERLRETLRRKAGAVPPKREVPPGLVRRALARIARNVSAVAIALAVVAIGTVTGVHALSGPSQDRLATTPPPPPACRAVDLSGSSHLMTPNTPDAPRDGSLWLTNKGATTCSLQDRPWVRVLTATGTVVDIDERQNAASFWSIQSVGKPPDWPVVTVLPGDKARVHVIWSNSCGVGGDPARWEIELPEHGGKVTFDMDISQDVPTCVDGATSSILRVGPFEP
jgi:hypothetical protein